MGSEPGYLAEEVSYWENSALDSRIYRPDLPPPEAPGSGSASPVSPDEDD
jgi:hypothetical protein